MDLMQNEMLARERHARKLLSLVRRALGTEAVARQVSGMMATGSTASDAIMAALDDLRHSSAEDRTRHADAHGRRLEQSLSRTEQMLEVLSHLDHKTAQLYTDILVSLRDSGQETHAVVAHLDRRLEELLGRSAHEASARLETSLFEHRWQQNSYFSRDQLPSTLAVKQHYVQLKSSLCKFDFDEVGLSVFSQNSEDGIILYIFSIIGMKSKRCVEIGCDLSGSTVGVPEGNTINLICNFAFDGLILEMDPEKTAAIRHFFARALTTKHYHRPATNGHPADYFSPTVVTTMVDVDNIDALFMSAGFSGDIDLLSIDVDGPDLLLWQAVRALSPRVVIIEVNNRIPFNSVVSGGYATSTASPDQLDHQQSRSSSLGAICQWAAEKHYVFVGMDTTLLNAFFVRQDAWDERLPRRTPDEYVTHRLNPLLDRPCSSAEALA